VYCVTVPNAVVEDVLMVNGTVTGTCASSSLVFGVGAVNTNGDVDYNGVPCEAIDIDPNYAGVDYVCDQFDVSDDDSDNDGYDGIDAGGDDCDDNDPDVHPGATELCDGVDQNCDLGIEDELDQCWDTVYRFVSQSSETRCWNIDETSAPSWCSDYDYEQEAFIVAEQQFDGNVELYSCRIGDHEQYWFDQILTTDADDVDDLEDAGYVCSQWGYVWQIGDEPAFSPFDDQCVAKRYYWDPAAAVGNGHVVTIFDSTTDLIYEGSVFEVVTDQTCF
jgi:hypothetical protein